MGDIRLSPPLIDGDSACIGKNHVFVSCFAKWREHHDGGIDRALDGSVKTVRKKHAVGLSRGDGKITKKQAEVERDKFLAEQNAPTVEATVERVAATGVALISEIKSPACRKKNLSREQQIPPSVPSTPNAPPSLSDGKLATLLVQ